MKRYDLIVVGAGPSGLSAAIEAAKRGLSVIVFDENEKPGGQLFKQTHKFFGSKEHRAKVRGFNIGKELLSEAAAAGVVAELNSTVIGLYEFNEVTVSSKGAISHYKGDTVIIATGAAENMVPFRGWTLPGVIGAGAAQTMMHLHGIRPGSRALMLGSGNVGLVVSFQLLQAGVEVVAVADAAPRIGGYGVHAAKVARTGVPFYLSHTIVEAKGTDKVERVIIAEVDETFTPKPGTEKEFEVDTICVAVGLSPMSQLLKMAGAKMVDDPAKGGEVPEVDEAGATSLSGVFAVGDVSGIEEASSAMIEGRMAGVSAAAYLGFIDETEQKALLAAYEQDLEALRQGMFAPGSKGKLIEKTDEGFRVSMDLLTKGYMNDEEVETYPGVNAGARVVMECSQNIPCNPCQDACPKGCITIGDKITSLPAIRTDAKCIGCGMCVASCSGQAIFLIDESAGDGFARITLPYEFTPLPAKGTLGKGRARNGETICDAEVVSVKNTGAFDHTALLTMKVPQEYAMKARFFR
ncbi:MAG: FAD-dependent oxidoreductase [Lachnospiraceae bacterium]